MWDQDWVVWRDLEDLRLSYEKECRYGRVYGKRERDVTGRWLGKTS